MIADGRTALALHRAADVGPDDVVAVSAAAGGVGSLLVQLAGTAGARVVGLVGSTAKADAVRAHGADSVVYRDGRWPERLDAALDGHRLSVAYDGVGGALSEPLVARLADSGRYLPHGQASGSWGAVDTTALSQRGVRVVPLPAVIGDAGDARRCAVEPLALAAAGALRPIIGLTLPLERAADAHAAIERREVVGKTLLTV